MRIIPFLLGALLMPLSAQAQEPSAQKPRWTLVIHGGAGIIEKDKIKPFGWWDELTGQMKDAAVSVIPDAGHCPQIEQPELVNDLLIRFLVD